MSSSILAELLVTDSGEWRDGISTGGRHRGRRLVGTCLVAVSDGHPRTALGVRGVMARPMPAPPPPMTSVRSPTMRSTWTPPGSSGSGYARTCSSRPMSSRQAQCSTIIPSATLQMWMKFHAVARPETVSSARRGIVDARWDPRRVTC